MVYSGEIQIRTGGDTDVRDITAEVASLVERSEIRAGIASVFVPGSTGAVTSIEYEPGVVEDLRDAVERLAPRDIPYQHDRAWGDGNGHAHVRAAILGASFTVPVVDGRPVLGTWQQIVFIDFDNRPRSRSLIVQVVGDR